MQTANVLLALGGKRGETVPKYAVTPAELLVLQHLHGADAVYDIEVQTATVERTARQEIERLRAFYSYRNGERVLSPAVEALFPGVGASVPKEFADLELPEELFAVAERRVAPTTGKAEPGSFDAMSANELRTYAEKNGIDVDGLNRKADLLEAVKLAAGDDKNLFK